MLDGKGISNGIGIGKAIIIKEQKIEIPKSKIENIYEEVKKLENAVEKVKNNIKETLKNISKEDEEKTKILEAYLMILEDEELYKPTIKEIKEEKKNCIYAVEEGFNEIIEQFKNIDDEYMAERALDIEDIKNTIILSLLGSVKKDLSNLEPNTIIVAEELTTSDTAKLDFKNIVGIINNIGGQNSHVSIMARTKEIPMVIGVENVTDVIKDGDILIVNGKTGQIILNPSEEELSNYEEIKKEEKNINENLKEYINKQSKTLDNYKVEVSCNIGNTKDLEEVIKVGADGIGLFRTEFLFMDTKKMPTEEEQFEKYKLVAETMKEKLAIIRTLDVGGDKEIPYLNLKKEDNPFLGFRAIRICLEDIELFKTQLRAILRASTYGNLAIMFPMISSIEELRRAKEIVEESKRELKEKNIKYNENIKIGIMIEIPAAVIMADELAKECDFFSIGTNDLIQYTVAVERGNTKIANLYTKNHPAVLRLIKQTIDAAHKNNIFCGMCGEAASNEQYIPLLIGMGLDEFSMNSSSLLKAKKIITKLNKKDCENLVKEVLKLDSSKEVEKKIMEFKDV